MRLNESLSWEEVRFGRAGREGGGEGFASSGTVLFLVLGQAKNDFFALGKGGRGEFGRGGSVGVCGVGYRAGRERVENALCGSPYAAKMADFEGGGRNWERGVLERDSELRSASEARVEFEANEGRAGVVDLSGATTGTEAKADSLRVKGSRNLLLFDPG